MSRLAQRLWVGPWVSALVRGEPLPVVASAGGGAMESAVARAAASVQRHLLEIEASLSNARADAL